ncbi:pseudouridine synthase [Microbacterium sp. Marseille-Q6965]|uniref:pseudouridine synthase n=1 Tax=Microbacterium sp. Marseille-Q6965 TaxID=2965072 RepID=UPI0021B7789A|nr:pseudouridine synthase [Microbacterium sp. Marseille-Q6965]
MRTSRRVAALPPREGIAAARLRAPGGRETHDAAHLPVPATVRDWLAGTVIPTTMGREQAFGENPLTPEYFVGAGSLVDARGVAVDLDDAVEPGGFYWFHKPIPHEDRVPFDVRVVHEDDDLLVVDKPHFLASTPNGVFVRECVVTRLRVRRGEDDLVAIHRLDRVTAGLLVLSRRPRTRGAYQVLFQRRDIEKTYRALAWLPQGWSPGEGLPLGLETGEDRDVRNRLLKIDGHRPVREVPGEPNAHTTIRLVRSFPHAGGWAGEFVLRPHTGKTHQLRVHMNGLGLPLLGDPVYPVDLGPDPYDFRHALQLLAERLEFDDPFTGERRVFTSGLTLDPARA